MRRSFTLFCLGWCILVGIQADAQNLKSVESVPESPKTIIATYLDGSGQLLRLFRDNQGLEKITSGSFAGLQYAKTTDGFVFSDGSTFTLPPMVRVLSVVGNQVLTRRRDPESEGIIFETHDLILKKFITRNSSQIPTLEVSASQLTNGTIIIDDFSEGYGTYLKIYNSSLKLINDYKPFDKGYSDMAMSSVGNLVVAVFTSNNNEKQAAIFNTTTGRLVNEGRLGTTLDVRQVIAFEDAFVLFDGDSMDAFSMTGSRLWSKSGISTPGFDIFSDNTNAYFFTSSDIVCVEGRSGTIRWTKPLSSMLSNARTSNPDHRIRPVNFTINDGEPGFVLAMMPRGTILPGRVKSDAKFVQFDNVGRIKKDIPIPGDNKFILVVGVRGGMKVFTNNETLTYED